MSKKQVVLLREYIDLHIKFQILINQLDSNNLIDLFGAISSKLLHIRQIIIRNVILDKLFYQEINYKLSKNTYTQTRERIFMSNSIDPFFDARPVHKINICLFIHSELVGDNSYNNGNYHGLSEDYYVCNCKLYIRKQYVNGKLCGLYRQNNMEGQLSRVTTYLHNKIHGVDMVFDVTNGALKKIAYYDNGNVIKIEYPSQRY